MANKNKKCRHCKEHKPQDSGVVVPLGFFCCMDHVIAHSNEMQAKASARRLAKDKAETKKVEKVARIQHQADKERVKKISKWQSELQTLVNQYVVHVRDQGKPCCTCGTNKPDIKYDCGHFLSIGAAGGIQSIYN